MPKPGTARLWRVATPNARPKYFVADRIHFVNGNSPSGPLPGALNVWSVDDRLLATYAPGAWTDAVQVGRLARVRHSLRLVRQDVA